MSENRRWVRTKPRGLVSTAGKIVIDPKAPVINCTVVDLSAGGACLELSHPEALPKRFEFIHGGTRRKCSLAWRRGFRIGVSY